MRVHLVLPGREAARVDDRLGAPLQGGDVQSHGDDPYQAQRGGDPQGLLRAQGHRPAAGQRPGRGYDPCLGAPEGHGVCPDDQHLRGHETLAQRPRVGLREAPGPEPADPQGAGQACRLAGLHLLGAQDQTPPPQVWHLGQLFRRRPRVGAAGRPAQLLGRHLEVRAAGLGRDPHKGHPARRHSCPGYPAGERGPLVESRAAERERHGAGGARPPRAVGGEVCHGAAVLVADLDAA
mmetsp:Transcript_32914/g.89154  ORF Transcript_32914/g.89154 Transcript_32914/m.89154 type:complete len:236 (-) Transcript_32914:184-891(-)